MSRKKKPRLGSPRDWVEGHAFPWPAPDELSPGDVLAACYAVTAIETVPVTGADAVFRLRLDEARGSIEAWVQPSIMPADSAWLRTGAYVGVRGPVHGVDGGVAAQVDAIAPLQVGLDDLALFLPSSARPVAEMEVELANRMASVQDAALSEVLTRLLGPDSEIGPGFRLAPAATRHHHAYLGGLLEHTLSVAGLCDRMAAHYGEKIDRDLLVTAALLHDVGKVREIGAQSGFPYTEEGRLLGHILLGLQMVADAAREVPTLAADRLLQLQHLIAAHQGRYEWQSPREPRTTEALLLHYADDLDARVNRNPHQPEAPARYRRPAPPRVPEAHNRARDGTQTGRESAARPAGIPDDDTLDMFA